MKLLQFIGFILYMSYMCIVNAFILTKLYAWFILSQFPELPVFTLLQWIGFATFVSYIKGVHIDNIKKEYKTSLVDQYTSYVIFPWIVLLISYIIHLFY